MMTKIPPRTLQRHIKKLKDKEAIKHEGSKTKGKWIVLIQSLLPQLFLSFKYVSSQIRPWCIACGEVCNVICNNKSCSRNSISGAFFSHNLYFKKYCFVSYFALQPLFGACGIRFIRTKDAAVRLGKSKEKRRKGGNILRRYQTICPLKK